MNWELFPLDRYFSSVLFDSFWQRHLMEMLQLWSMIGAGKPQGWWLTISVSVLPAMRALVLEVSVWAVQDDQRGNRHPEAYSPVGIQWEL